MSRFEFYELKCRRCGGELQPLSGGMYRCESCGKAFKEQIVEDVADQLRKVLDEQKQEAIANLRQQLWAEMHGQYINSEKIVGLSRDIKKYLPEDYFANFCEVANSGNDRQVSSFLNNTPKADMADYADVVLDFMLKSVTAANLNAISLFIERTFKGDTANYDKYITAYEREAQKVNSGIYELIITRDVFLAYSSADMPQVLELCDYLEGNGISCFLALRNLRHGRGAVDNYDRALKTAIDNCKTVVFVSSCNSRDTACDALMRELPYIKQKDIESAPAEYKRAYDRMPAEYMMPRVEYLIEDYEGGVAEMITKEFFHGLEWCKSKEAVANRILKYLTEEHETAAQKAERERKQFQQQLEEERRKAKELELKIAEAQRIADEKRAEAERAKIEAEERLARARIEAEQRAKEQNGSVATATEIKEDPNAKYCKSCRTANKYTAKFCSNCGGREFFANFDEYLSSKIKFCAACGAQNDAEDKFCAECGSKVFVLTEQECKKVAISRITNCIMKYKKNLEKEAIRKGKEEQERLRKIQEEKERQLKEQQLKELSKLGDYKDVNGGYITFGTYPQSKKTDSVKIGQLFDKERGYYLGSDNNLYAGYKGEFYKIEPIKWKVLQGGGKKFIVADDILDAHRFSEMSNNYANSELRHFINVDFYNKAFNDNQNEQIVTTTVDNSCSSTGDSKNPYICENTCDKVFLLSKKEAEQYLNSNEAHRRVPTEYAVARGTYCNNAFRLNGKGCGLWWLRSPYTDQNISTQIVNYNGSFRLSGVGNDNCGVVPAMIIANEFDIKNGVLVKYNGKGGNVELPEDITEIGEKAFYRCANLKKLFIPKSIKKIGIKAFDECPALDLVFEDIVWGNAYLEEENKRKEQERLCREEEEKRRIEEQRRKCKIRADFDIKDNVIIEYKGVGGNVEIPYGVTSIGDKVFADCISITGISIPDSVIKIGVNAFLNCQSLTEINVSSGNKKYESIDGNLYRFGSDKLDGSTKTSGKTLIQYAGGKKATSFTIPNGVRVIEASAFFCCSSLNSIVIPDSVGTIGKYAFFKCSSITNINIPNSVTIIGNLAFSGCEALTSITIADSVTSIGEKAFDGCKNLKTIYCRAKKPLFGLPKGWDKNWLGNCQAQIVWNYKG